MFKWKRVITCTNHKETKAAVYCSNCRMFMCPECETAHNNLFVGAHKVIPASSVTDFDLQGGKCKDHRDYPLDSFCTDCLGKQITIKSMHTQ